MNSVLNEAADAVLNEWWVENEMMNINVAAPEESYATTPLAAARSASFGEDELHSLFESAISSRLFAMRDQMNRISGPLPHYVQQRSYETDTLPTVAKQPKKKLLFSHPWQRTLVFGSLTLMLTLLGFDLMGLLILSMR